MKCTGTYFICFVSCFRRTDEQTHMVKLVGPFLQCHLFKASKICVLKFMNMFMVKNCKTLYYITEITNRNKLLTGTCTAEF